MLVFSIPERRHKRRSAKSTQSKSATFLLVKTVTQKEFWFRLRRVRLSDEVIEAIGLETEELASLNSIFSDLDSKFVGSLQSVPVDIEHRVDGYQVKLVLKKEIGPLLKKELRDLGVSAIGAKNGDSFRPLLTGRSRQSISDFGQGAIYIKPWLPSNGYRITSESSSKISHWGVAANEVPAGYQKFLQPR